MKNIYGVFTPYNQTEDQKPRVYNNGRVIGTFYATLAEAENSLVDAVEGSVISKMVYVNTGLPFVGFLTENGALNVVAYFQDISDALEVSQIPEIKKQGVGAAVYALVDPRKSDKVFHSVEGFKSFYKANEWVSAEPQEVLSGGSAIARMFTFM